MELCQCSRLCAHIKIPRRRSSRDTRGHDRLSLYYVFQLSFLYLKSNLRLLTGGGKLRPRISITMQFRLKFERETLPPSQHVFWIVLQMYGAFKQTFRRRCINYCSFKRVMNRFLWNIIGFIHQQSCSVYRRKLTFRCCPHLTVPYSNIEYAAVLYVHGCDLPSVLVY